MNHKITGERRDWLLCLWFIQLLVPREENPRKQSGTGLKIHSLHWWEALGSAESCSGLLEAHFGVWGCEYPPSPLGKGEPSSLETQMSLFLYGSFQNIHVIAYSSWKGGPFHTGYILAADVCPSLDPLLPPVLMEKPLCGMWRPSRPVLPHKVKACPSQRDVE